LVVRSDLGCTVAGNLGWPGTPGVFVIYSPDVVIEQTIVAFNEDDGFLCAIRLSA